MQLPFRAAECGTDLVPRRRDSVDTPEEFDLHPIDHVTNLFPVDRVADVSASLCQVALAAAISGHHHNEFMKHVSPSTVTF
jgi:hypothetical protein